MLDLKIIGENIKKERKRQLLTIAQLAEMVGITENFLGKIERGDSMPSLPTINNIATALDVSIDYLKGDYRYNAEYQYIKSQMEKASIEDKMDFGLGFLYIVDHYATSKILTDFFATEFINDLFYQRYDILDKKLDNYKLVSIIATTSSVKSNAFKNCIKLNNDEFESIRFSSALTIIGTSAFENCSALNVIILPDGVSAVGDAAFKGCINLEEVLIPASVTDIGNSIFENCSKLYNVKIEKEVGNIPSFGVNVFNGCNALESIKVKQNLLLDYKNEPNLVSVKDKIFLSMILTAELM